mmetsp:Transcript_7288/g.10881  ORF Transcript_7288/g.10881 Transcript_7288/m.10881 type:complete len:80 (-) Transcript_7288:4190-4429(-)
MSAEFFFVGFMAGALTVFNDVAMRYPNQTGEELWDLLQAQLFNNAHVERQRDLFEECRWIDRKESVELFAERLRQLSHA